MDRDFLKSEDAKRLVRWGTWMLIVLTVFLGVKALAALKEWKDEDRMVYNSISVTGEGEAMLTPDIATFSFSVNQEAKTPEEAQNLVTPKMNAIKDALKALGIEDRDIATTNYWLSPKVRYESAVCGPNYCPPGREVIEGYTVSHDVQVKVRDTNVAGDALAALAGKGATNISNLSFTADDPSAKEAEAREKAIEDAKAKAEVLADQLGVKLVRVVGYYDNQPGYPMPMYRDSFAKGGTMMETAAAAPSLPIGENKIQSSVSITYEIR